MADNRVTVLYRISNSTEASSTSSLYNAFEVPRNRDGSITLSVIKRHCAALRYINELGPDGYHWRVRVDDRTKSSKSDCYTWWDIKDENARLPVKENVPVSELERMFMPSVESSNIGRDIEQSLRPVTNAASGAFSRLNKAMSAVANTVDGVSGPSVGPSSSKESSSSEFEARLSVIAFKLLDLVKLQKNESTTGKIKGIKALNKPQKRRTTQVNSTRPARAPVPVPAPARAPQAVPSVPQRTAQPNRSAAPTAPVNRPSPARKPRTQPSGPLRPPPTAQSRTATAAAPRRPDQPLMDFTDVSTKPTFHKSNSMPINSTINITRAQKLKQEYEQQAKKQNRVWDKVDQRWVVVEHGTKLKKGSIAEPPSSHQPVKKGSVKGIFIDANNARGKSAHVQNAVMQRVDDLKKSQTKALNEHKQREANLKQSEEEEDIVRKKLEPKIKAWSEEHGKKRQLRALLSSLHLILWEGSGWKQVCLGDILDEKKARRVYLKATLKVHPDKTRDLDAEKRFIAKRVFDALSQAMKDFDNQK